MPNTSSPSTIRAPPLNRIPIRMKPDPRCVHFFLFISDFLMPEFLFIALLLLLPDSHKKEEKRLRLCYSSKVSLLPRHFCYYFIYVLILSNQSLEARKCLYSRPPSPTFVTCQLDEFMQKRRRRRRNTFFVNLRCQIKTTTLTRDSPEKEMNKSWANSGNGGGDEKRKRNGLGDDKGKRKKSLYPSATSFVSVSVFATHAFPFPSSDGF